MIPLTNHDSSHHMPRSIETTASRCTSWSSISSTSLEAVDIEDLEIWRAFGPRVVWFFQAWLAGNPVKMEGFEGKSSL